MDFVFFPPEVNSTRMYTGPGSGSLLAAAGSWDSLAAELGVTAQTYQSVVSTLSTLQWRGPAAQSMSATAAPYIGWLNTTAEQTRQSAMQARAAAAAYELAHAMTIPPMAVFANRTQLATLVATNFFGQNTPAIAQTETQYAEYWAQDAAAMSGYAAAATAATTLLPAFSSPKQTSNESGLTAQKEAVANAANAATASTSVSQALSGVTMTTPTGATTPAPVGVSAGTTTAAAPAASALPPFLSSLPLVPTDLTILNVISIDNVVFSAFSKLGRFDTEIIRSMDQLGILPDLGATPELASAPQLSGAVSTGGGGLGDVTATLARADTIGRMSVPASWTTDQGSAATALSRGGITTLEETGELARPGSVMPGVPGLPGGTISRASGVVPRYGARLTVMPRPPAAG